MRFWLQAARFFTPVMALVAATALTPDLVLAASTAAGGASLQIPPGARAEGMGRFFTAIADDAFTPWWNPAGLAFMEGWNAGLMHARLVPDLADDVYFEYLGVSNYLEGWGGVAGTFTYLNYGESVATGDDPTALGTFSSFEFSPSVALGTAVIPNLGIGFNLKLLHVNLTSGLDLEGGGGSGTTFAVDLGALYQYNRDMESFFGSGPAKMEATAGVMVGNLGPDISLVDERQSDPLPRNLKVGVSWGVNVPKSYSLLLGAAVEKGLVGGIPDTTQGLSFWERNEVLVSGGLELGLMDILYGRLGYLHDDVGKIKDMTYGFGIYFKQFGFDFASIPQFVELDRVSKFSVVARFD
jgi:hypothetical protein